MWNTLPELGTAVVCAILVVAAYTFAVALAAHTARPRLLAAARLGTYGAAALVALAVLLLAHGFVAHDFRLDYVARYSDRGMTTAWQIAALWGGQDGSLLWWLLMTAIVSALCVRSLGARQRALAPWVIATLMSVLAFVAVLMLFAANPFRVGSGGPPADGQGLGQQLRDFNMIVHPPSLYLGFTSAVVPFGFALGALVSGRLDGEWLAASRKWMLFSWLMLSIGNALGMLWAYDELGWGGYWAWDPVENASLLPWLTATAFVHSVIAEQHRRRLRIWNLVLVCLTFLLTYFGTFLTRSGLIASVHAFARSSIGVFFVWFMAVVAVGCAALIGWRMPLLRGEPRREHWLSRDLAFAVNNWLLLGLTALIALATLWPRLSEWLRGEAAAVGPAFYNTVVPPIAVGLLLLMGVAPLLGWRRTSPRQLWRGLAWPLVAALSVAALHLGLGDRLELPPFVRLEPLLPTAPWRALARIGGKLPVIVVALVGFNLAVVAQSLVRAVAARRRTEAEGVLTALVRLLRGARRRYGGALVHVAIAIMFLGFAGRAWGTDAEARLAPGESMTIGHYRLHYRTTTHTVDHEKQMDLVELEVSHDGRPRGVLRPGQHTYQSSPGKPASEVARLVGAREDLYVFVGAIDPASAVVGVQAHVNPFVSFVWLAVALLVLGALVVMWPARPSQRGDRFDYVLSAGGPAMTRRERLVLGAAVLGTAGLAVAAGLTRGPPLAVLVLAAGALVAAIAMLWCSLQALLGERPLRAADAFALGLPGAAEDRKRAVLGALEDLERQRARGMISEQGYRELSLGYRAEAARLLRDGDDTTGPSRARAERLLGDRLVAEGLVAAPERSSASAPATRADQPDRAPREDET